ncbi:hypothetical protein [Rhizomonospora bruguierae]|uniref:hypothetical protein n=1 Tax=Rhizomonospora bruguierae TaxID=1581705 RepID=UPI001BCDA9D3|nr:hypothetical protein [Micromonospora sp. NBRC 107566]
MLIAAVAAIPLTVVLTAYALRPTVPVAAPLRLAAVRAALAVGAYAVLVIEAAGAAGVLTGGTIALAWTVALAAALGGAAVRYRRAPSGRFPRPAVPVLGAVLAALVLAELSVALLAPPNNYDSQTYHLPRIEHWLVDGGVGPFATPIHRQVTLAPGAEYLLAHLRLLTGGDALYNLLQWCAGVGCLLLAARIAAQLGGGRRAQLVTAVLVGGTPMVVLQATSTQSDLVAAAWAGCVATLVLDGLRRPARLADVLALGAATGLTAVTKNTGLLAAGPLLALWIVAQVRLVGRRSPAGVALAALRAAAAGLGVLAAAAVLVGPFIARTAAEFGSPLGPRQVTDSIPTQRHDPAAIVVNAARIAHTALDTPLAPLRRATADGVVALARALHVDPQDPRITFPHTTFPVPAWYPDEDKAAFPVTGVLAIVAAALALSRPGLLSDRVRRLRGYAGAVVLSALLYPATVKWQPWGNRLLLYALVLAAPLAGLWLDRLLRTRLPAVAAAAVLAVSLVAGVLAVGYGYPRRLVGRGSVLTTREWELRFLRRPQWAGDYRWAAGQVAGAHRVGMVLRNDDWEYPWWVLLRRDSPAGGPELVELRSVIPGHPPADMSTVDAVVCTAARSGCARSVPSGWRLTTHGSVTVALPPAP